MGLYLGNVEVSPKVGEKEYSKIYLGDTLIAERTND